MALSGLDHVSKWKGGRVLRKAFIRVYSVTPVVARPRMIPPSPLISNSTGKELWVSVIFTRSLILMEIFARLSYKGLK